MPRKSLPVAQPATKPTREAKQRPSLLPHDIKQYRDGLKQFLRITDASGRRPASAKCGVYAFYDYEHEPIYVGQTLEKLSGRIGRHLTNQRTDAVAMGVLDPLEVCFIAVYPFYDLEKPAEGETPAAYDKRVKEILGRAEYTLYRRAVNESKLGAVLNEADIPEREMIDLPPPTEGRIVPDELYELWRHPDIRIARRASTIGTLARVISERDVSSGLRRTLHVQAQRLERLARARLDEALGVEPIPVEMPGEETGEQEYI